MMIKDSLLLSIVKHFQAKKTVQCFGSKFDGFGG